MFEKLRNFFGMHVTEDVYDIFDDAARKIADYNDLKYFHDKILESYRKLCHEHDELETQHADLKRRFNAVVDEYENLSRKYFALKTGNGDRVPAMKDEFAPKCTRKEREVWSYFRLRDRTYIPALKKFIRHSGHWTLRDNPEVRETITRESVEPVVEFDNEKCRHVQIPFGSVFLVNEAAPKTEWMVIPEDVFNREWAPTS